MKYEINSSTQYAGFWIRVGACCIDVIILLIPNLLVSFLLKATQNEAGAAELEIFDGFLHIMIWWIYFAVLHSSNWQATIGKKVLGLKVVDKNGGRISFGKATGRYFAQFLSHLIFFMGFMMVGWTKKKQGLHDKIAGTLVIKVPEN
jgi:uncharacterized RDD family membrane protein YckC